MKRTAASLCITVVLGACGTGSSSVETTASTAPTSTQAPTTTTTTPPIPTSRDEIAAFFDPIVGPMGFAVTRASLVTRADYKESPEGDHLAIYLIPTGPVTFDDYARAMVPLARVFLPMVFDLWPQLESMDFCQETYGTEFDPAPSQTLFDITREVAAEIDWAAVDLATLIRMSQDDDGLAIFGRFGETAASPTWTAATSGG